MGEGASSQRIAYIDLYRFVQSVIDGHDLSMVRSDPKNPNKHKEMDVETMHQLDPRKVFNHVVYWIARALLGCASLGMKQREVPVGESRILLIIVRSQQIHSGCRSCKTPWMVSLLLLTFAWAESFPTVRPSLVKEEVLAYE